MLSAKRYGASTSCHQSGFFEPGVWKPVKMNRANKAVTLTCKKKICAYHSQALPPFTFALLESNTMLNRTRKIIRASVFFQQPLKSILSPSLNNDVESTLRSRQPLSCRAKRELWKTERQTHKLQRKQHPTCLCLNLQRSVTWCPPGSSPMRPWPPEHDWSRPLSCKNGDPWSL